MNKLISEYIRLTTDHGKFIQEGDDYAANKTHSKIRLLVKRIEKSDMEVKSEYFQLLTHPNSSVRLWTAIELIGTDERKSRTVIEEIANDKGIIGLTATTILKIWNEGSITKSDWQMKST